MTHQGSISPAGQMLKVGLQMSILLCHSRFERSLKPNSEVTVAIRSPVLYTVWGQCQITGYYMTF